MGEPALAVDPVIAQTRELTHALFAASLGGQHVAFFRSPSQALEAWTGFALRRGDVTLATYLERLDPSTFVDTWSGLLRRVDTRGLLETFEWLQKRIAGEG